MQNDGSKYDRWLKDKLIEENYIFFLNLRFKRAAFASDDFKITFISINEEIFNIAIFQSESYSFNKNLNDPLDLDDSRLIIISVEQILGYELIDNSTIIERKSSNFGKMIAGGLLFGGLGAIAGSISSNKNHYKTKSDFRVRLILDSLSNASVDLKCESSERAYQLLYTLSLLEERFYKKNEVDQQSLPDNDVKMITKTNSEKTIEETKKSYYDEIIKIKDLCDKGIITIDEFETLKKKIING